MEIRNRIVDCVSWVSQIAFCGSLWFFFSADAFACQERVEPVGNPQPLVELQTKFGIPFKQLDRKLSGAINAKPPAAEPLARYALLLRQEFGLYPKSLIKRLRLKRVVLCERLAYEKQLRAAIPDFEGRTLYLDVSRGRHSESYQRLVIHHEFYHLIDYVDDGSVYRDRAWSGLNDPGFRYGAGGAASQNDPTQSQYISRSGFLTRYSLTGVEEDKAEIFAHLMVNPSAVRQRLDKDVVLSRKVNRLTATLFALDKNLNKKWWTAIEQSRSKKPRKENPKKPTTNSQHAFGHGPPILDGNHPAGGRRCAAYFSSAVHVWV